MALGLRLGKSSLMIRKAASLMTGERSGDQKSGSQAWRPRVPAHFLLSEFRFGDQLGEMREPLVSRRAMLAQSATALLAFSSLRWASAEELFKKRSIAITIDDGPATSSSRELEAFL